MTKRAQRQYRIAFGMVVTIALVFAVLIWSSSASGNGSSSDAQVLPAATTSEFDANSFFVGQPELPAASNVPERDERPGPDHDIVAGVADPPGLAISAEFSDSPEPQYEGPRSTRGNESPTEADNRAPVTFWQESAATTNTAGASARAIAPAGGGGSSPGGFPSSAATQQASTSANGLDDRASSLAGDSNPAVRASTAATDHRGSTATGSPAFSGSPALTGLSADASWAPPGLSSLVINSPASSLAALRFGDAATVDVLMNGADTAPVTSVVAVPEPGSLVLFGGGLVFLVRRLKRRARNNLG